MTLKTGSYHCLYGSWADGITEEQTGDPPTTTLQGPSIETDRFLRLLPKYQTPATQWQLFGPSTELWFVQCYDPR